MSTTTAWMVHKFGGTSVAGSDRYRQVAEIVCREPGRRKAVVVSAMSGVTNALIELVDLAVQQNETYLPKLAQLKDRHLKTVAELFPAGQPDLVSALEKDFKNISELLRGIWLARSCTELTVELISGHGEIWSAQFLAAHFRSRDIDCRWLDAREVLVVEPQPASVSIDWETSRDRIRSWTDKNPDCDLVVITGFIASTREGLTTTLKRNGSDYSASIFGALLNAAEISIWTDVDGVLSADPRLVPEAVVLDELSYSEATELAYFGAKVVHPSTMEPAIKGKIPIRIRNTFRTEVPGTTIHAKPKPSAGPVKGFATIDRMALLNVEGTGMIGVPGIAQRLFGALREVGVSVVMISQASSEHSICFVIPEAQSARAKQAVEETFFSELHHGQIQTVSITHSRSVLAAVGDNMVERPGVAAKFFGALGKAGISVQAIAQGSSERNISAVIAGAESSRALRAVHAAFYLSHQTISIGVVGAGLIGGTFLDQLSREAERLKRDFRIDLRVRAIATSRRMWLGEPSISLDKWRDEFARAQTPLDLKALARHVATDYLPHSVIVDATASLDLPGHYAGWLKQGLHLITPNKKGNSGTIAQYRNLQDTARAAARNYFYSTTVGAGLPVLNTLRDLIQTGDKVHRIEGVLSGTLSFLFNSFDGKKRFSDIVKDARSRGYTEPDPRDDLSGMDVARKLVILAREMGMPLELEDLEVENLVDLAGRKLAPDDWLAQLSGRDAEMEARYRQAAAKGECLRYVGTVEPGKRGVVRLGSFPASHPFAGLTRTDNMVVFHTDRYREQPLVIRGPGAGPEVTAAGVFADLLRLTSRLGGA